SEDTCALDDTRLVAGSGKGAPGVGRLLGSYQLVCLLGEGGMGNIYIGRHLQLNRYVAIKVLRPEVAKRKDNVARFFHEAHTINRLRHPNIVASIDLVEDVADGAYCVLELLKGQDLKTRLEHGHLSVESTIHIGVQLADALGKVHALGVVHRDLKPENLILIERDGRDDFVKLIDFGVAQIGFEGEGGIVGTAAYMAPEQGIENAPVDARADIYSLGVLLFEMVTGRHPFPSSTDNEYLVQHADTAPPRPSRLSSRCPLALEAVILKCLEKNPEHRFVSADQVAATLRMIDPTKTRRSRAGWFAAALLVAGGAGAAGYFVILPKYISTTSAQTVETTPVGVEPVNVEVAPVQAPVAAAKTTEPASEEVAATEPAAPSSDDGAAIVEIGIESKPAGASVFRAGETVALGVTPFTVPLSRSDKPVKMRFEKAGYQPKQIEVPIAASLEIEVSLAKEREPAAAKSSVRIRKPAAKPPAVETKQKPLQREGTIDPFAK
ncbi:MAG TPA: serine/threonine-protein kinase, partial [Kofleriaceae bacterium]